MDKQLSKKIAFFNFFLAVLIVILHSNSMNTIGWTNDGREISTLIEYTAQFISYLGHLAVPLFFIISAYLYYRNVSTVQDSMRKIKKRVRTLFVPYLLWNAIFTILFWGLLHSPASHVMHMDASTLDTWQKFLISIIDSRHTQLWFVRDLIIFVLLSPIFVILKRYTSILVLLITAGFFYVEIQSPSGYNLLYWLPIYCLGILFSKPSKLSELFNDAQFRGKGYALIHIAAYLFVLIITLYLNDIYVYRLIAPLIVWRMFNAFIDYRQIQPRFYWKYSFFIYCVHFFLLSIFQKILYMVLGCSNMSYITINTLTPLVIIPLCIAIAYIAEKKIHSVYGILTGNR